MFQYCYAIVHQFEIGELLRTHLSLDTFITVLFCTCINITSVLRFATDIIIRNNRKSSLALNGKNEFCITKKLSASSLSFNTIIWANRARPARQRATTSYVLSLLSHCYCCCEIGAETQIATRCSCTSITTRRLAVAFSCFATMVFIQYYLAAILFY